MPRHVILICFSLLVVVGNTFVLESKQSSSVPPNYDFVVAHEEHHYDFMMKGTKCRLDHDGVFYVNSKGITKITEKDEFVRRLYINAFKNDVILLIEVDRQDAGSSKIITLDWKSKKIRWARHIPAFNLGPSVIEDSNIYTCTMGNLIKFNLLDGTRVWTQSNLYGEPYVMGSCDTVELKDDRIVVSYNRGGMLEFLGFQIEFNKESGKIVRFAPN